MGKTRFDKGLGPKTAGGSEVRGRFALVGEGKILAYNSNFASVLALMRRLLELGRKSHPPRRPSRRSISVPLVAQAGTRAGEAPLPRVPTLSQDLAQGESPARAGPCVRRPGQGTEDQSWGRRAAGKLTHRRPGGTARRAPARAQLLAWGQGWGAQVAREGWPDARGRDGM